MSHTLNKRDVSHLSTGAIAGIIVGIVVVFLILVGLFIWRFIHHRNDFGPYTFRNASAKEKALAQARGHVRSTRPTDVQNFDDDKTGLVTSSGGKQRDIEDGLGTGRPSPIQEDAPSLNGTVGEAAQHDDVDAMKGKQRQQEADYEIFQGHHATSTPAVHDTLRPTDESAADPETQTTQPKRKIAQGCTTM